MKREKVCVKKRREGQTKKKLRMWRMFLLLLKISQTCSNSLSLSLSSISSVCIQLSHTFVRVHTSLSIAHTLDSKTSHSLTYARSISLTHTLSPLILTHSLSLHLSLSAYVSAFLSLLSFSHSLSTCRPLSLSLSLFLSFPSLFPLFPVSFPSLSPLFPLSFPSI